MHLYRLKIDQTVIGSSRSAHAPRERLRGFSELALGVKPIIKLVAWREPTPFRTVVGRERDLLRSDRRLRAGFIQL